MNGGQGPPETPHTHTHPPTYQKNKKTVATQKKGLRVDEALGVRGALAARAVACADVGPRAIGLAAVPAAVEQLHQLSERRLELGALRRPPGTSSSSMRVRLGEPLVPHDEVHNFGAVRCVRHLCVCSRLGVGHMCSPGQAGEWGGGVAAEDI